MIIERITDELLKATSEKEFWKNGFNYGHVIYGSLNEIKLYKEQ